jgi:hypothetical protein
MTNWGLREALTVSADEFTGSSRQSVARQSAASPPLHTALALVCAPLSGSPLHTAPVLPTPAAGVGAQAAAPGALAAAAPPLPAPALLRPGRCQISGCSTPYEDMRPYNKRCRLCTPHMRAEVVAVGAVSTALRFCQKCVRGACARCHAPGRRGCDAGRAARGPLCWLPPGLLHSKRGSAVTAARHGAHAGRARACAAGATGCSR